MDPPHHIKAPPQYGFEQPPQGMDSPPQYQPQPGHALEIVNAPRTRMGMSQQPPITSNFGPDPQTVNCQYCNQSIQTAISREATTKTHLVALLLCCLGCIFGCCLIPYCVDSCKNTNHKCPICGEFLGTYQS